MIVSQRSFGGGEITPALWARCDTAKYSTALKTMRNFFTMRHGGAASRAGTSFVAEVKDSSKPVRLIEFVFNADQTYVLEFGELYMRVHRGGQQLQLAGSPYEIVTPYLAADLKDIQYVQSADVITLVHKSYPPQELKRTGHTAWTLTPLVFSITMPQPDLTNYQMMYTFGGGGTYLYKVTAVDSETYEESLPNIKGVPLVINAIDNSTPTNTLVTTVSDHGFAIGETLFISVKFATMHAVLNGQVRYKITSVPASNSFYFANVDGSAVNVTGTFAGANSPVAIPEIYKVWNSNAPTLAAPITLRWPHVDFTGLGGRRASSYNVYRAVNGVFGYLGRVGVIDTLPANAIVSFSDVGASPDLSDNPPSQSDIFSTTGNYPGVVTYFQQRLMFANTTNFPEKIFGSQTGRFKNFAIHTPLRDDDAVTYTMAGRQVNEVRHLLDLTQLIILTSGGEHSAQGDGNGTLTPRAFNRKQYDYNGAAKLPPIVIGGSALYVQAQASIVRDLGFEYIGVDNYRGNDLSIYSAHLVDGHTIIDWAYQKLPHSIVWCVRDDGVLLGLTYVREQQMVAWHRHDTDGIIENVCSVPEGGEYSIYLVVRRTINGVSKRFVERMNQRRVAKIEDFIGMDSTRTYDGRNIDPTLAMTLSGGTTWASSEVLTLTSSAAFFSAGNVGQEIHFTLSTGAKVRFAITTYVSTTQVTGSANVTVPAELRATASLSWARAVKNLVGLTNLEAKKVSILGDGFVVANPNNGSLPVKTVTSGALTLDKCYAVIQVGLPFFADLETLDIDTTQGQTLANKGKLVREVTLHVENSRSVWVGAEVPVGADPLDGLREEKLGTDQGSDVPMSLLTGKITTIIRPEWNSDGHIFVRQTDPLPLTILAISPAGLLPFKGNF